MAGWEDSKRDPGVLAKARFFPPFREESSTRGESLMVKVKGSDERRRFNRFTVKIPVKCKPVAAARSRAGRESVYAAIKNISSNGILLEWPREYWFPQFLRLGIEVVGNAKPIDSLARIVWAKEKKSESTGKGGPPEQYDIGLSFVKDENSNTPRMISLGTDFYWGIFERTGDIQAYLLHKRIDKRCKKISRDG